MNADEIVNYFQSYIKTNNGWLFGYSVLNKIDSILTHEDLNADEKVQCIAPLLRVKENMKTEDVSCLLDLHQAFFIHYCKETREDRMTLALSHDSYPSSFPDNQEAIKSQFKAKFYDFHRDRKGVKSLSIGQRQALNPELITTQTFQNCAVSILFQASNLTAREAIGQSSLSSKKDIESALKECKFLEPVASAPVWTNKSLGGVGDSNSPSPLNNNDHKQPVVAQFS